MVHGGGGGGGGGEVVGAGGGEAVLIYAVGYGGNGRGAQGQAEEHARLKGRTKEIQEEL